jgi:hypothetical protein
MEAAKAAEAAARRGLLGAEPTCREEQGRYGRDTADAREGCGVVARWASLKEMHCAVLRLLTPTSPRTKRVRLVGSAACILATFSPSR